MNIMDIINEAHQNWVQPFYLKHNYPVFVNPSREEVLECAGTKMNDEDLNNKNPIALHASGAIRFVIDSQRKKMYIAPDFIDHVSMCRAADIPYRPESYQFHGIAKVNSSGEIRSVSSDTYNPVEDKSQKKEKTKYHWEFADKYFTHPLSNILQISPLAKVSKAAQIKSKIIGKDIPVKRQEGAKPTPVRQYYKKDSPVSRIFKYRKEIGKVPKNTKDIKIIPPSKTAKQDAELQKVIDDLKKKKGKK